MVVNDARVMGMRWVGHIARMRDMRNAYIILAGKFEGKRALGRTRHRWKGNIKMYVGETRLEGVGRIHLAHGKHGNEPCGSIKGEELLG
jgi:hypothetical protein